MPIDEKYPLLYDKFPFVEALVIDAIVEAYKAAKSDQPDNSIEARIAFSKEHSNTRQPVELSKKPCMYCRKGYPEMCECGYSPDQKAQKNLSGTEKLIQEQRKEISDLRNKKFAHFNNDECWIFQGDGHDYPNSLTCPVVMSADNLRQLLKRESGSQWQLIENLPKDKLTDDVFCSRFNSRGDCCWVVMKRTLEQVRNMMEHPTHWMYVPSVTTHIEGQSNG